MATLAGLVAAPHVASYKFSHWFKERPEEPIKIRHHEKETRLVLQILTEI